VLFLGYLNYLYSAHGIKALYGAHIEGDAFQKASHNEVFNAIAFGGYFFFGIFCLLSRPCAETPVRIGDSSSESSDDMRWDVIEFVHERTHIHMNGIEEFINMCLERNLISLFLPISAFQARHWRSLLVRRT
jgi:hypothetical protein